MTKMIAELGENPEMQAQFEAMMHELVAAGAAPTDQEAAEHIRAASDSAPKDPDLLQGKGPAAAEARKRDETFQDTIRKTMERMQQSSDTATAASSNPQSAEDELLAQMMRDLQAGGGGAGGEEDFNSMIMSMMTQLTNKEILYEPMKELHDKFPDWMEKNKDKEKKEDLERYQEQQKLVAEIVATFEKKGYSDDNEADRDYIIQRMQKVCGRRETAMHSISQLNPANLGSHPDASGRFSAARPCW
jgi:peroxin-19